MTETVSDFARFMLMTNISPRKGGCWEWNGNRPDGLYGHFSAGGRTVKAHRWIYEKVTGPIPEGLLIRHKCDNPSCVNPDHLEVGTNADNVSDMHKRGRAPNRQGVLHPLVKLKPEDVLEIRKLRACGVPETAVAKQFQIGRGQVGKIARRENWRHL